MLVVIASLPGKPDKREQCLSALRTLAAASRDEPGCVSYSFAADIENPDRYVSVELWQDQTALDAHFGTPHVAELLTRAGELLEGTPEITTYTVS